jgi:ATP-binding protein involved in chromosome partitioning
MSYLQNGGERMQLFPKGDLDAYLDIKKIPKLVEIPFLPEVGVSGEAGVPYMEAHSDPNDPFARLATQVATRIS